MRGWKKRREGGKDEEERLGETTRAASLLNLLNCHLSKAVHLTVICAWHGQKALFPRLPRHSWRRTRSAPTTTLHCAVLHCITLHFTSPGLPGDRMYRALVPVHQPPGQNQVTVGACCVSLQHRVPPSPPPPHLSSSPEPCMQTPTSPPAGTAAHAALRPTALAPCRPARPPTARRTCRDTCTRCSARPPPRCCCCCCCCCRCRCWQHRRTQWHLWPTRWSSQQQL